MGKLMMLALRAVLVVLFAGSVFVQAVMVPLVASEPDEIDAQFPHLRPAVVVIAVLGLVTVEVVLVCVWRLATMARRGNVFSRAAFRYVDVTLGAIVAAALLVFTLAGLMVPGEAIPPGGVVIVGGVGVGVVGVALIVFVLRMLLAQAVTREAEAKQMRDELDEVI